MKKFLYLIFIPLLTACPSSDEDCDDLRNLAIIPRLIKWEPIQDVYQQGDEITISLEVPSENNYYGRLVDFEEQTEDRTAKLILTINDNLEGNELTFIKGRRDDPWFAIPYSEETGNYELEFILTLNKLGEYLWISEDLFQVNGGGCNRYEVQTNIDRDPLGGFRFEVVQ